MGGTNDILSYRPGEDSEPTPLLAETYNEFDPAVSPDGRWIAYASNETGADQVYVRPFPDLGSGRWQVSSEPARYPRWAPGGRELYYQDTGAQPSVWMVEFETTEVFQFGAPDLLFESPGGWNGSGLFGEAYEVADADERFLIPVVAGSAGGDGAAAPSTVLVNNFFEELTRLVPN